MNEHRWMSLSQRLLQKFLQLANNCRHRHLSFRLLQQIRHRQLRRAQLRDLEQPNENRPDSYWQQQRHHFDDLQSPNQCRQLHPRLIQNHRNQVRALRLVKHSVPHHNLFRQLCQQRECRVHCNLLSLAHQKLSCNQN